MLEMKPCQFTGIRDIIRNDGWSLEPEPMVVSLEQGEIYRCVEMKVQEMRDSGSFETDGIILIFSNKMIAWPVW